MWMVLVVAAAWAVPPYSPGVQTVPPDLAFSTAQVQRAVGQAERDVHVVVVDQVLGQGVGDYDSATERYIEETWSAWARAPGEGPGAFDAADDLLVVLALDDREVRVRTGSTWDAEHGLWGDALLPIIDATFLPKARANDLDGGLASLVRGLDAATGKALAEGWVTDHVGVPAPLRFDGGEAVTLPRFEATWRAKARAVVYADTRPAARMSSLPGTTYLAELTARVWADAPAPPYLLGVVGRDERLVVATATGPFAEAGSYTVTISDPVDAASVDAALDKALTEVDARVEGLQRREEERAAAVEELEEMRQTRARAVALAGGGLAGAFVLGMLGLWLLWQRRGYLAGQRLVEARLQELDWAEERLADLLLELEASRVSVLALRGDDSERLVEGIATDLAEIREGLEVLRTRAGAVARGVRYGSAGSVRAATEAALAEPFRVRAQQAPLGLFAPPVAERTLEPDAFMGDLEARFEEVREAWSYAEDAALALTRPVAAVVAPAELLAARERCEGGRVPERWLAQHPLWPDAVEVREGLDALRRSDPVAFVEEERSIVSAMKAFDELVGDLAGARAVVAAAKAEVAGIDLDGVVTRGDPREGVHTALEAFEAAWGDANTADKVVRAASEVVGAAEALSLLPDAFRAAAERAEPELMAVLTRQQDLAKRRQGHARGLARILATHAGSAPKQGRIELSEADDDLGDVARWVEEARAAIEGGYVLDAMMAIDAAHAELSDATTDLSELATVLDQARLAEDKARGLVAALDSHRAQLHTEAARHAASHGVTTSLHRGDALYDAMKASLSDEPRQDWGAVAAEVDGIRGAWSVAMSAGRKAERRAAAAREQRRRARTTVTSRARASASSTSRSSSSLWSAASSRSSRPSRASRSSGSSFSSRSRSSGRKVSRSSRSGGRSYGSSRRSGGRKF